LCAARGKALIWRGARLRVIYAAEEAQRGFAAFYRVVWHAHVAEFSDLAAADQLHCMQAVACVEQALPRVLQPDKINLAALGNVVPHLHWHVIARHAWDSHFPAPVWAAALRARDAAHRVREAQVCARLAQAEDGMRAALQARD